MKSPNDVPGRTVEDSSDDHGTNFLDILFAKDAAAAYLVI